MIGRTTGALWQGAPQCAYCMIRDLGLFSNVEQETIALFEQEIARITFPAGTTLYFAGDPGDAVMTLRAGAVKLVHPSEDGRDRIVRLLRTGDVLGLEALVGEAYQHIAVALRDSHVCRIPRHTLARVAERAPQVNQRIMHQWQQLVAQADEWLAFLAAGPARCRVARLLLYLAEPAGGEQTRCLLPGREDMASMLGITVETASRIVADLRRQGVVHDVSHQRATIETEVLTELARG